MVQIFGWCTVDLVVSRAWVVAEQQHAAVPATLLALPPIKFPPCVSGEASRVQPMLVSRAWAAVHWVYGVSNESTVGFKHPVAFVAPA